MQRLSVCEFSSKLNSLMGKFGALFKENVMRRALLFVLFVVGVPLFLAICLVLNAVAMVWIMIWYFSHRQPKSEKVWAYGDGGFH
ncbi:MAG: hypothetical protein A3E98_01855 [Candidatus Doudnabacteria bacterium RIFCSPHIGHO2_12_FULL_48_11]|uniref:Uncharacterized protein n=1 Tax=Candidatus Doudnabacteria bacterium RIFCSPHIGHO2_01_FULL_46_24 TaxID=1817825 RepID=A0A1F5NWJ9_9BACT|nr:MAG: hypothetical protein A2720_02175 [Candidatus Doudnabacteria bacterium RIFCSPHIGHO2_01_FULL_46_24]OGE95537.1 MAG: hypothetical protein A3E98_01855 [Candidatus Doudnabacteria bacterium RIFCSPHIGHO2_12_FULL_48_11]